MKIGELSQKTGLPASRIRYYEKQNLLPRPMRNNNGYRNYHDEVVERLKIIDLAKSLGFSLSEIREVLPKNLSSSLSDEDLINRLEQKLIRLDQHMLQLQETRSRLMRALHYFRNEDPDCERPELSSFSF